MVVADIEKAFDFLGHSVLLASLKKHGYRTELIKWIEVLLEWQESCITNGGNATKCFKLQKSVR